MSELRIDHLHVRVANAAGHERRLEPIARQAAALLAERVARRLAAGLPAAPDGAAHLVAARVDVNLAELSDDAAAERIASAWFTAQAPGAGSRRLSDGPTSGRSGGAAPRRPAGPAPAPPSGAGRTR